MNAPNKPPPRGGDRAKPSGKPASKETPQAQMPPRRTWLWFLLILFVNYLIVNQFLPSEDAPVNVPYTLFKAQVGRDNVEAIFSRGETISGRFLKPVAYAPKAAGAAAAAAPTAARSTSKKSEESHASHATPEANEKPTSCFDRAGFSMEICEIRG